MEHKISITVEGTGPMSLHDITHQVIQTEPKKVVHTKNSHNEIVAISIYDELYRWTQYQRNLSVSRAKAASMEETIQNRTTTLASAIL